MEHLETAVEQFTTARAMTSKLPVTFETRSGLIDVFKVKAVDDQFHVWTTAEGDNGSANFVIVSYSLKEPTELLAQLNVITMNRER